MRSAPLARLVLATAWLLAGCGGGAPLLHPAHALPASVVEFAAGSSGHLALGGLHHADAALDRAGAMPGGASDDDERQAFARGALTRVAVAPGVAPFVSARAGLGAGNEAGITYTGRSFRVDGRHAFEWPNLALSVGGSLRGDLNQAGHEPSRSVGDMPGGDAGLRSVSLTSVRGYGLELPVLFGYRSSADVVKLWAGLRAGFGRDTGSVTLVEAPDLALASAARATRVWGGGLVGFSVGLKPIEARVELDAAYESVHGSLDTQAGALTVDVRGWSLTPAMAICAKF